MQEISLKKALWIWVGSAITTVGLFAIVYMTYRSWMRGNQEDPCYYIQAIVQTGPEKEALKTAYLAELLDLSVDRPLSLYALNLKRAEERLLLSPLISQARVRRLLPHTLYVDYTVRKPVALLADYHNVGLDAAGYLFPLTPFFTPKQLPEIYLGLPPFGQESASDDRKGGNWGVPLHGRHVQLALELMTLFNQPPWGGTLHVQRIDVSNAFAKSLGQREIVLFLEEEIEGSGGRISIFPKILRLSPKEYLPQLARFDLLRKKMKEDYRIQIENSQVSGRFQPRVIDLRIAQLAFVQES